MIETVLFDLDGVFWLPEEFLSRTLPLCVAAMREAGLNAPRPDNGSDPALEELLNIRMHDSNGRDHFDRFVQKYNGRPDPAIIAAGVCTYEAAHAIIQPIEGVVGALHELQQDHLSLGVITNGDPTKQAAKLRYLGLHRFFSRYEAGVATQNFVYASNDTQVRKPNMVLFAQAKEEMRFEYETAMMVGDRIHHDLVPAQQLGMMTCRVLTGKHAKVTSEEARDRYRHEFPNFPLPAHEFFEPGYAIHSLGHLPATIRSWNATFGI